MTTARTLPVAALTLGALGLLASPASAATVTRSASCANDAGSFRVQFAVDDTTRFGTLRSAQGMSSGVEVTADPVLTVRVRNGAGTVVVTKTSRDGSMSLTFSRVLTGPRFTAEATLQNTSDGPCTTRRVPIALTAGSRA